jgi:hypothetical protein
MKVANLKHRQKAIWLTIAYALVLGSALYPGFHEGLPGSVMLWNWLPPTLSFILIATALGKSRRRIAGSTGFGLGTAVVALLFFGCWLFTPLDMDPHSSTTTVVFICAPLLSIALGTIVSGLTWLASRSPSRVTTVNRRGAIEPQI